MVFLSLAQLHAYKKKKKNKMLVIFKHIIRLDKVLFFFYGI